MNKIIFTTCCIALMFSCSDSKIMDKKTENKFSRSQMLKNYSDSLIIPEINKLLASTQTLYQKNINFTSSPSSASYGELKDALKEALTRYQYCSWLNFGPGDTPLGFFSENIGTFPANTTIIGQFVANGDTAFSKNFKRDTRGLFALEYLIYQFENVDFATAKPDSKPLMYMNAVAYHIKANVEKLSRNWQTYSSTFVNSVGTDASSSTSLVFNESIADYEKLKNYKLQYPMGKRAGQTKPEPQDVEAFYSGLSVHLLKTHFKAVQNRWNGRSADGNDGLGFDDYLLTVEGGKQLHDDTKAQFAVVEALLNKLPENKRLSDLISEKNPDLDAIYIETAKLTRFIKSELSSKIGIYITYSSGDGD